MKYTCKNCSLVADTFVTLKRGVINCFCENHASMCGILTCSHCGKRHPTTVGSENWQQEHDCTAHRELVKHWENTPENRKWWADTYPELSHYHTGYGWCWDDCDPDHYHPCYRSCKQTHDHHLGEPCWEEDCRPCPSCGGHYDGMDYGGRGCSRRCAYGGWGCD